MKRDLVEFASAASGLVSVPTSGIEGLAPELVESNRIAAKRQRIADIGAFELDPKSRRLSMLRMSLGFAARAHAVSQKGHRPDVPFMVTLTYAKPDGWAADHVKEAIRHFRNWCKRKAIACRYVWIAEVQDGKRRTDGGSRDVIHYHIGTWLPVGVAMPFWDRKGWWPHGSTRRDPMRSASAYLMSYLKKDKELSAMPKGARAYGVGGLDHSMRRARRWLNLPSFVQGNSSIFDNWNRRIGGGWTSPSGEHVASEFASVVVAGARCLIRVAEHARAIVAGGPFCWITDRETALSFVR